MALAVSAGLPDRHLCGLNQQLVMRRPIMEGGDMLQLTKDLYEAPFALLFHNNFVVDEPVLMYANKVCMHQPACIANGGCCLACLLACLPPCLLACLASRSVAFL